MPKSCIIISGGDFSPIPQPGPEDFVIACDKGYAYAQRCGIRPDLVISDFDSFDGDIDPEIPVNRFRCEKDDTDTMLAVRYAVTHGFDEVRLYCALGGRLDHTLANLQTLVFAEEHGLRGSIHSEGTVIHSLRQGSLCLPRRDGWALSVFSATDRCEGVSICGVKYPLDQARLSNAFPLGVSNEWTADEALVSVENGVLHIVEAKLPSFSRKLEMD